VEATHAGHSRQLLLNSGNEDTHDSEPDLTKIIRTRTREIVPVPTEHAPEAVSQEP